MNGIPLETRKHNPYLSIDIQDGLKRNTHIANVTSKANRSLNFLRHNLAECSANINEQAYNSPVRPNLEYAAAAWDP